MAKAFSLNFEYTPKWKGNRSRPKEDMFTVRLKDFSEQARIEEHERFYGGAKKLAALPQPDEAAPEPASEPVKEKDEMLTVFAVKKSDLSRCKKLVEENLVSISGLVIQDGDKELTISDYKLLEQYCPDLVVELAKRLLDGADEEERKN